MRNARALAPAAALWACAALVSPGSAHADAPLVSETADVIGVGDCQIEAALAQAKQRGLPSARAGDLLASCGVGGNSQAALGYSRARAEGLTDQSLRIVGKTTLVAPEAGRTGWGLRYGVSVDKAAGEGWRREGLELLAVMTSELAGGVLLHVNLGHAHSRSAGQGSTVWSLGFERGSGGITVAADVFGDDRSRPWLSAGIGAPLSETFSVNASVAMGFEQPRPRQLSLGAKLTF